MPNIQSTYLNDFRPGFAGMRAGQEKTRRLSRMVETVGGIGFGKVVKQGSADRGITGDISSGFDAFSFVGITMAQVSTDPANPDVFAKGDPALVMRSGCIWVAVSAAVTAGTDVTVDRLTGAFSSAVVGTDQLLVPNAKWETSTTGAGLAVLRLA